MPATQDLSPDIVMSSRALELLTCFQDEFDGLVTKLAEEHARKRAGRGSSATTVIEVGVDDVKAAGRSLLDLAKALVSSGALSEDARSAIQEMNHCLDCNGD